jgi:hypothetical protein
VLQLADPAPRGAVGHDGLEPLQHEEHVAGAQRRGPRQPAV